ncbi:MAG: hypothetical protein J5933_03070 [Clostridia bacterium]|nr:hypothetical protein [Clostridia bacterium]
MKEYKKPTLEVIDIEGDVITASGAGCEVDFAKCAVKCADDDKCQIEKCVPEARCR